MIFALFSKKSRLWNFIDISYLVYSIFIIHKRLRICIFCLPNLSLLFSLYLSLPFSPSLSLALLLKLYLSPSRA